MTSARLASLAASILALSALVAGLEHRGAILSARLTDAARRALAVARSLRLSVAVTAREGRRQHTIAAAAATRNGASATVLGRVIVDTRAAREGGAAPVAQALVVAVAPALVVARTAGRIVGSTKAAARRAMGRAVNVADRVVPVAIEAIMWILCLSPIVPVSAGFVLHAPAEVQASALAAVAIVAPIALAVIAHESRTARRAIGAALATAAAWGAPIGFLAFAAS